MAQSTSTATGSLTLSFSLESLGFITWLVFLILKLTNPAFSEAVSWFWVWFPLWIPAAITVALLILLMPVLIIIASQE